MRAGFWSSSIGKKYCVAGTGLILSGFVVVHMLGNLQVFLGPDALNGYAEHLEELPALLWPARAVLLTALIVHMAVAGRLTIENRRARPIGYAVRRPVASTFASRTMIWSGLAIFFFIVFHLLHFTFGRVQPALSELADSSGRHDVYTMVVAGYRNPWIAGSYLLAMACLCLHLSHGIGALFQSAGASDEALKPFWSKLSRAAAAAIFLGNTSIVAASYFGFLKLPGRGL